VNTEDAREVSTALSPSEARAIALRGAYTYRAGMSDSEVLDRADFWTHWLMTGERQRPTKKMNQPYGRSIPNQVISPSGLDHLLTD
jgi:hypothetical protein